MRVILDTNIIVSGLISPHGPPAHIIAHWLDEDFKLLYTPDMLVELEDVLARAWLKEKMAHVPNRIDEFLDAIAMLGELVMGYASVAGSVRDPFDEMFLACAVLGRADYIVTGDKDLLLLVEYESTQILSPSRFLEVIRQINS
jgi:hypothetical protein